MPLPRSILVDENVKPVETPQQRVRVVDGYWTIDGRRVADTPSGHNELAAVMRRDIDNGFRDF